MKLIIAGSRSLKLPVHEKELAGAYADYFDHWDVTEIVSGGADGVDKMGENLAHTLQIKVKQFLPDYSKYGPKQAPLYRNTDMAAYADGCLVLWDGKSRGSQDMVKKAMTRGLHTVLITIKP